MAVGLGTVTAVAYVYFAMRRRGRELLEMNEDDFNKACGLEAPPFRELPLDDVDGLMKALASGEVIKVDCKKWAAEQAKTVCSPRAVNASTAE